VASIALRSFQNACKPEGRGLRIPDIRRFEILNLSLASDGIQKAIPRGD